MPDFPAFDLVLPCYNPAPRWAHNVLASVGRLVRLLGGTVPHVVVVNDGSATGIAPADLALLEAGLAEFTYVHCPLNQGKGHALRQGVAHTHHALCVFTDIDFPYQETSLVRLVQALAQGQADIVAGVRDPHYYAQVPAARVVISKTLRFLTRQFLRLPISDTQTGLKGFNEAGRAVFLQTQTRRYLFDLEFLYLAARQPGLRTVALEVQLKPGVVFSRMNLKVLLTEGSNFVRLLLR